MRSLSLAAVLLALAITSTGLMLVSRAEVVNGQVGNEFSQELLSADVSPFGWHTESGSPCALTARTICRPAQISLAPDTIGDIRVRIHSKWVPVDRKVVISKALPDPFVCYDNDSAGAEADIVVHCLAIPRITHYLP